MCQECTMSFCAFFSQFYYIMQAHTLSTDLANFSNFYIEYHLFQHNLHSSGGVPHPPFFREDIILPYEVVRKPVILREQRDRRISIAKNSAKIFLCRVLRLYSISDLIILITSGFSRRITFALSPTIIVPGSCHKT